MAKRRSKEEADDLSAGTNYLAWDSSWWSRSSRPTRERKNAVVMWRSRQLKRLRILAQRKAHRAVVENPPPIRMPKIAEEPPAKKRAARKSPTGRRPTSTPNLQSLPMGTPEAKRVRAAMAKKVGAA